jgi:hypothetical protein
MTARPSRHRRLSYAIEIVKRYFDGAHAAYMAARRVGADGDQRRAQRIMRRCWHLESVLGARAAYHELLEPLRATARDFGYALAVHGSTARDIDLVAVPWADIAVDPLTLAEALRSTAARVHGRAYHRPHRGRPDHQRLGSPGEKPHGRLVWTFHLGGGPYIDLSVMPRILR